MADNGSEIQQQAKQGLFAGYASGNQMQLGPYLGLVGVYNLGLLAFLATAPRKQLPERIDARDLILLGVATHKISRLITKDWVTSPLRAPFTRYQGSTGASDTHMVKPERVLKLHPARIEDRIATRSHDRSVDPMHDQESQARR